MQIVSLGDNCMKCQILFTRKKKKRKKKNIISLSSAEFSLSTVSVNRICKVKKVFECYIWTLNFTILWGNSADDKIIFSYPHPLPASPTPSPHPPKKKQQQKKKTQKKKKHTHTHTQKKKKKKKKNNRI